MKKQWFPGLVAILLIFLFAGCFQPLSPKLLTVQGVVVSPTGERVPFADVIIDGQAAAQTDAEGGFSVSLKQGEHTLLVKEPGAQSQSKYFELSKNLNLQITLNQINLTSGWRYRKTSEGYTASLVLLLSEQTKALSVQIGGVYDRGQVALLNDQTFLWVESDGLSTQIDWVPLSQDDSEGPAVFVAFEIGLPALKRIKENARLTYSDKGTKTNGDYREMISQKLAGRGILPSTELTYVGDMVSNESSIYAPNGVVNIHDLVRLLMNYNEAGTIQTGDLANAASWTNFKRNPFNRAGLVRDGLVSIPDLMILLMAYNLNTAMINTPIAPYNLAISSITGGYELTWEATAADVNDGYKVYGSATQTSGERLAGTLIDTIDGSENRVYEGPIAFPFVYVTAKNGATYESTPSEAIAVPQGYDVPKIALTAPANGALNQPTKPTLTWVATPGELLDSSQRGADITLFKVYIAQSIAGLDTVTPVELEAAEREYTIPADLPYASTWYWKVIVEQGAGNETTSEVWNFTVGSELMLELSEEPLMANGQREEEIPVLWLIQKPEESGISQRNGTSYAFLNQLFGRVSTANPSLKQLQFYLQYDEETENNQYPGGGSQYNLTNGEYSFTFPWVNPTNPTSSGRVSTTFPAYGLWYMWVQATGNAARSDEKPFEIKKIGENDGGGSFNLEVTIEDYRDDDIVENGDKVCPETEGTVTALYTVSVDFSAFEESGIFLGYQIITEVATKTGEPSLVATYTGMSTPTIEHATVVELEVDFATECWKYATVTLHATFVTLTMETTPATEAFQTTLVATHSFILDMANPTASVTLVDYPPVSQPASITMATVTFFATDTKCLRPYDEKIEFEIYVDKGIGSWSETFDYFTKEVIIGEGGEWENEIMIDATYVATKTSASAPDTAMSTMIWHFKKLDLATVTATMTVQDCCDDGCIIEDPCADCGGACTPVTHATEVTLKFAVDNVFFSSMLDPEEIDELEGVDENAATPTIPATPDLATLTVRFADANWSWLINCDTATVTWALREDAIAGTFSELFATPTFATRTFDTRICSGYATKTILTYVSTFTADPGTTASETTFTLVGTAVDCSGNEFPYKKEFWYDTLGPTLTRFEAFRNQLAGGGYNSFIEFSFHEEPVSADLLLGMPGSSPMQFTLEEASFTGVNPTLGYNYRLFTNITLPTGYYLTLIATAVDTIGNKKETTLSATVNYSSPR